MSDSYAVSLAGMRSAEQRLDFAARSIALGRSKAQAGQTLASSDAVPAPSANPAAVPPVNPVDFAAEMVTVIEARMGFESNLKAAEAQQELDRSTLDLLA